MNRLTLFGAFPACVLLLGALIARAVAQSGFDQAELLHSTNALPRGLNWLPSASVGYPEPTVSGPATAGQFRGAIVSGAATRSDSLLIDQSNGRSKLRASVGMPYLSHGYDYLFGQEIIPPSKDIKGDLLTADQKESYWSPVPVFAYTGSDGVTINDPSQAIEYYWSLHQQAVYATKPGQVPIWWRVQTSALTDLPPGGTPFVTHVKVGTIWYPIKKQTLTVSGVPFKTPRTMYWTKGDYAKAGKLVAVPAAVKEIKFLWNLSIPESVPESEVVEGSGISRNSTNASGTITYGTATSYTSTIANEQNFITAYNKEGRIFMELLGDATGPGTRRPLGFEIIDVQRDAVPADVTIELGERVTAYPDNSPSDSALQPSPIAQQGSSFAHQRSLDATGGLELYATHVTHLPSDYQVHWLEQSVAGGLRWPFRFVRYAFVWPTNSAKYSHYLRPAGGDEASALLTAIPIPGANAPVLEDQDPAIPSTRTTPRAKVTTDSRFYTFLDQDQPWLRALLRYNVGDRVAFERVFSVLDSEVNGTTTLLAQYLLNNTVPGANSSGSVSNLTGVDAQGTSPLHRPRYEERTASVGQRLAPPSDETASTAGYAYLAGHIQQSAGTKFSVNAYLDPLEVGLAAAAKGAIIPINAGNNDEHLEVWWFRTNAAKTADGFKTVYWPSVISRYTLNWPTSASEKPDLILASNAGSGPLTSLETQGHLYFQNDRSLPGYNPNEEHALLQGGRVWALRDDLNITTGTNYSSHPYALLEYTAADGRPSMSVFRVLRETDSIAFDYQVEAGTVLQAPMPLPLLDKPIPPTRAGQYPKSINAEVGQLTVRSTASAPASDFRLFTLTLTNQPPFLPYEKLWLSSAGATRWLFTTTVDRGATNVSGFVSSTEPSPMKAVGPVAGSTYRHGYTVSYPEAIKVGSSRNAIIAITNANAAGYWAVMVTTVAANYIEVDFGAPTPSGATDANLLVFSPETGASDFQKIGYEKQSESTTLGVFYAKLTYQDRKGDTWVYRGPHDARDPARLAMEFYYKTIAGFWFPTDATGTVLGTTPALTSQPAVGTITPYLRPTNSAGVFLGDSVYGHRSSRSAAAYPPVGAGNPLAIAYHARWPDSAPVLQMAETLTVPKRGLPAVRGQTSLEVLYQQSLYPSSTNPSVVLHDPTVAKKFKLFDTKTEGTADDLNQLPSSIQTSVYLGKTFFPRLAPHLVDRFYFDSSDSKNGSLIFQGEFKAEVLGESYLLLNVISTNDLAALKGLCDVKDSRWKNWTNAIEKVAAELETFVPNKAKPGTFTSTIDITTANPEGTHLAVHIGPRALAVVTNSDTAVDSYALTATGPGTGYVTLIAGQGLAFTPTEESVSVKIIRVVDTLYHGEVKVILSSNPLGEKVTMQQIVDLAGQVDQFEFDWRIAAPVDGSPPAVYGNTATNLLFSGSPDPWHHLPYPLAADKAASLGTVAATVTPARFATDVSTVVVPVNSIPFATVAVADGEALSFVVASEVATRLTPTNAVTVRNKAGAVVSGYVSSVAAGDTSSTMKVTVQKAGTDSLPATNDVVQLYERVVVGQPQSIVYRDFSVPSANTYSQYYLSLTLDDALGAKVYVDGALVATANLDDATATTSAPSGFTPVPLAKVYGLGPEVFAAGTSTNGTTSHRVAVELFSSAIPDAALSFDCQIDAYQSEDLVTAEGSNWLKLDPSKFPDGVRTILGESADVRALSDNYVIMRYRASNPTHASYRADVDGVEQGWSQWTDPALAEGWIKRVLAGINPFNQRTTDLLNNTVNTDASILASAGKRWEGDVALNQDSINDYGLIEIYETVLRRGKDLSINAGIIYDPANDALLLAAGYLSDLYMMLGNDARADAANPTIGIGTKDRTYGDVATALFAFKGQLPSLLEEELALLRGRDDFLQPGVRLSPAYNRLIWNYTRGIDSGEVIYVLNYNILDQNTDGAVDATDAAKLYPQGHGDAYGHYLTALKGYYSLLVDKDFTWVPRIEAVNILGKAVAIDYQDERKFAAAAAAVARTGRQIFDLTWRRDYQTGADTGWEPFSPTRDNTAQTPATHRYWGADHWAARTGEGAYLNWAIGNSILPPVDPDSTHEGIQKVDRTTVLELPELAATASELQTAMDNAEGHLTPLGLATGSLAFDINPSQVTGPDPKPHFEQIYQRALGALNNAVASFNDAKDVTRLMRSEQDSLAELQASVVHQEQAYTNALIELYGTPYPDDVGAGKLYKQGYAGPDLYHSMYVETETIEAPGIFTPNQPDYVAKLDIQQLNANWSYPDNLPRTDLTTDGAVDGSSSDLNIVNGNDTLYESIDSTTGKPVYYIPYAFGSHGFFDKPATWTSSRRSAGKIQQAISEIIQAHDRMYSALGQCEGDKQELDKAVQVFRSLQNAYSLVGSIAARENTAIALNSALTAASAAQAIGEAASEKAIDAINKTMAALEEGLPKSLIAGVAAGGDLTSGARAALEQAAATTTFVKAALSVASFTAFKVYESASTIAIQALEKGAVDAQRTEDMKAGIFDLGSRLGAVQGDFQLINEKLRLLDDAKRRYAGLVAEGDRLQQEREIFRQRSAAIVQGFRTRDAAFRIFRNEKLERYKSLFDLSARYTYLAANAYDYETGLLNTTKGKEFVSRIVNSRALGVVKDGSPQFGGSDLGDPGLSSVLAEMKADWDVLKGRLGFNNPTASGTTFSLRTEKHRILPGAEGLNAWKDVLNNARRVNVLEDADVKRFCMQIDPGNGLPVPGLVIEFETTIADGYNFFGQTQQGWDHYFDSSSFATKIFAAGVAFPGYVGMDNPMPNSVATAEAGGYSPGEPDRAFLDPDALGATPGIYLIPVGLDSMRSPALGDAGNIRTWTVDDVTIPLPFNIGASEFSSKALYQSSDSLSEPLFGLRKHPSFRPVSTTAAFTSAIYGGNGALAKSQFTNTRLIGRSVWNSKWKLVIPGTKLLHDPDEGLQRFINTVTDIKLHLITYSYSGN